MVSDRCPYCGQAAHASGSTLECPARSDLQTVVASPTFDGRLSTPTPGSFDPFDSKVTTKLSPGTLVGEYRIVDRIGEGGMGTVYSAVHPIIGKKVAIKILAGRLANNKNAIRRFVLEARAVNDIRHPGLVDIFSFGQLTDGRHYYVMEFLAGRNLGEVLRERVRLPMAEAIPIFLEVGQTLVAVHAKGIVHRDLKPENILLLTTALAGGQRVKLVDFGLAKLVEGVPAHLSNGGPRTAAGVNVGTPHYMSPEQCRGMKVDARSDLYALGVLLYETLTGSLPFDGATSLDIWQAHVERPPVPPMDLAPAAISAGMNAVVLRLLAKRPEERMQSAAQFCAALKELGQDGQGQGRGSGRIQVPPDMHLLAQALSNQKMEAGLIALDAATREPVRYDELAATTEDLPIVTMPSQDGSAAQNPEEERRKEIDDLRASFGLHIDEPATDSHEEQQISALAIDLSPPRDGAGSERSKSGRVPTVASGAPKLRPGMRPIEERHYQLEPPSTRKRPSSGRGVEINDGTRLGKRARILVAAAALVAIAVAAFFLLR